MKCNLQDGAMLGAKTMLPLHQESRGEKSPEILFQIFHSLLAMKNKTTSACFLTTRILAVNVSVVLFFIFFFTSSSVMMVILLKSQFLANKPK